MRSGAWLCRLRRRVPILGVRTDGDAQVDELLGVYGNVVFCESVDEACKGNGLVKHERVVGEQDRRDQHRGRLVAELIGDVAKYRGLTSNVVDQVGPTQVVDDDPVQVSGIERNPVVEAGPRARNDSERNRRDGGIHAEDMCQDLVGVPTSVTGFAEIGSGRRR